MPQAPAPPRYLLAGVLAASAFPAAATRLDVEVGRSFMDGHPADTAFVELIGSPRPIGLGRVDWAPDLALGWIGPRDLVRYRDTRYDSDRSVTLAAAGARFHVGRAEAWYRPLFIGFQLAANDHETHALSSHYQFVSTIGWQGRHLGFRLRHISNGALNGPNRGETMALIGIGFDL